MQKLPESETVQINEYYARISKKLRNIKYLMILLMVVSLVFILWAYRNRLTYDNFRYLLRDMDEAGNTVVSSDSVYYTANDTNNYLFFRGDLAVASSDGVALHRALGSRSFEDDVIFKSPSVAGSEKYMIAYDIGGTSFYVYNSISRVYNETLERTIADCAAADNGNFAVLTKNNIGGYVIRLYDKNFRLSGEITRERYVYAVDYFDGERLGIFECVSNGITLSTDFLIYTVGSEDIDKTVRVPGMVLECGKTSDGFYLLYDTGLSFFDNSGEKVISYSFGTSGVMYADAYGDAVAVLLDENKIGSDCGVYVYTAEKQLYSAHVDSGAKGIALCGDDSCILYDGKIVTVNDGEKKETEIPNGGRKIIRQSKESLIVCYNDYARIFEVE